MQMTAKGEQGLSGPLSPATELAKVMTVTDELSWKQEASAQITPSCGDILKICFNSHGSRYWVKNSTVLYLLKNPE